jgi:hypothetical protein
MENENINTEDKAILDIINNEEQKASNQASTNATSTPTNQDNTANEGGKANIDTNDTTNAEKKKGRGRPKGSKKEINEADEKKVHTEKTETKPNTDKSTFNPNEYNESEEIKNLQNEHNSKVAPPIQAPAPIVQIKPLISGYLLLVCINTVMPNMIVYVFGMFSKKVKGIDPSKIKLDHQERKDLEPIADEVAKVIFAEMNPIASFLLSLSFMYGGKLMNELEKQPKK